MLFFLIFLSNMNREKLYVYFYCTSLSEENFYSIPELTVSMSSMLLEKVNHQTTAASLSDTAEPCSTGIQTLLKLVFSQVVIINYK